MWRLFISLYVVMFVFILCVSYLPYEYVEAFHTSTLIEDKSKDGLSWLIAIEHFSQQSTVEDLKSLFSNANLNSNYPIEVFTLAELTQQYPQAENQFDINNTFWLNLDDGEFLYRMENLQAILKVGPMSTITELSNIYANSRYLSAFLLAVVIFIWQINLWRKLNTLEQNVVEFGEGNLSIRASEKPADRVGKLNTTFNRMAKKTSELLLQNRQLIRAVSHELRAPLSRLQCLIDLLGVDNTRSQNATYLDDMSKDIMELENLVDEILNYSRLEASDTIARDIRQEYLKPVLVEMLHTINRDASKEITLTCEEDIAAKIDVTQFSRAVGNLVQNAAHYSIQTVEISAVLDTKNALVSIHVDDDGPGIPLDERNRIFDPFSRLDQSRTRDSGGYGLGLAIVKQIAHLHRGNVEVTTSPMNGARFSLVLPSR